MNISTAARKKQKKIDKEEEEHHKEVKARAARADTFNFDNMMRATPIKNRTPARSACAPAREQIGFLQDGLQYFMYAYQDFIGNQLVNLEVQLQGPAEEGNVHVELVDLPGKKQGIEISQSIPETWLSTNFYS